MDKIRKIKVVQMERCPVPEVDSTGNYRLQQDSEDEEEEEWENISNVND